MIETEISDESASRLFSINSFTAAPVHGSKKKKQGR